MINSPISNIFPWQPPLLRNPTTLPPPPPLSVNNASPIDIQNDLHLRQLGPSGGWNIAPNENLYGEDDANEEVVDVDGEDAMVIPKNDVWELTQDPGAEQGDKELKDLSHPQLIHIPSNEPLSIRDRAGDREVYIRDNVNPRAATKSLQDYGIYISAEAERKGKKVGRKMQTMAQAELESSMQPYAAKKKPVRYKVRGGAIKGEPQFTGSYTEEGLPIYQANF